MTEATWRYLQRLGGMVQSGKDPDDVPEQDIRAAVDDMWADAGTAAAELIEAWMEIDVAEDNESGKAEFLSACEAHGLGDLPNYCRVVRDLLYEGVRAVSAPAGDFFYNLLRQSADLGRKTQSVRMLYGLRDAAAASVPLLVAELADSADPDERLSLRGFSAAVLGKLDLASPEVVEVLARVAADRGEYQPLRSYCIEALMDLGPAAAAAIPVLREIKANDEDDDLRHFAWSALKSVRAASREHPCGGTVADHMRSLYHAVQDSE
jgi:hypothetical protein